MALTPRIPPDEPRPHFPWSRRGRPVQEAQSPLPTPGHEEAVRELSTRLDKVERAVGTLDKELEMHRRILHQRGEEV